MSPEQAQMGDLEVDARADIYALGTILYELLTGRPIYDRDRLSQADFGELLRIIRDEDPPMPSTRVGQVSSDLAAIAEQRKIEPTKLSKVLRGDLDWITMKALEKDRSRRYQTASALADDVVRYLNHEPVEASPPSVRYRMTKFARRHRRFLIVTFLFALLLTATAIISAWLGFAFAKSIRPGLSH
jgi:hypothetical protein